LPSPHGGEELEELLSSRCGTEDSISEPLTKVSLWLFERESQEVSLFLYGAESEE
jgi:hypothetical protein